MLSEYIIDDSGILSGKGVGHYFSESGDLENRKPVGEILFFRTNCTSAVESIQRMQGAGVAKTTHFVVSRDGTIGQVRSIQYRAKGFGELKSNPDAITVMLSNPGCLLKKGSRYFSWDGCEFDENDVDVSGSYAKKYWLRYPAPQLQAVNSLLYSIGRKLKLELVEGSCKEPWSLGEFFPIDHIRAIYA